MSNGPDVTKLLIAHREGDDDALGQLIPLLYDDLRRIAQSHLHGTSRQLHETASLVHEAYMRLVDHTRTDWNDRNHFLSVCARAMRQIVISTARKKMAAKRGGDAKQVEWTDNLPAAQNSTEQLLDLERALERLQSVDERLVRIIECRYFAAMTEQETADAVGVSLRTCQRDWNRAKAWLRMELGADARGEA